MLAFLKKHRPGCLLIAAVLYLLVGAMAPFAIYPQISEYTKAAVRTEQFFENTASGDRAMILETGQSAWEERIRLMDRAEKRIVLTTFDMREGKITIRVQMVL